MDTMQTPQSSSIHPGNGGEKHKTDPITALQDGIDGLSLAMFEALRGLRDAVAPESGNLGDNNNNVGNDENGDSNNITSAAGRNVANAQQQQHPDLEELWQLYRQGDEGARQLIQSAIVQFDIAKFPTGQMPQTRDQVAQIHAKMEQSRDTELVLKLAKTVLDKSRWIDCQVDQHIPGMHRTIAMQQQRIHQLLNENAAIAQDLQAACDTALQKRNACRFFVQSNTCQALDIEDNTKNNAGIASASLSAAERNQTVTPTQQSQDDSMNVTPTS